MYLCMKNLSKIKLNKQMSLLDDSEMKLIHGGYWEDGDGGGGMSYICYWESEAGSGCTRDPNQAWLMGNDDFWCCNNDEARRRCSFML